jgi:HK97 family phage prohead protease
MHIKSDFYIEKATKLQEGEVEFIVSSGALDAHGERIDVDGIDIKDFKKNPVVLWGHDGFNLPIGKATKVWKESGKLMARAKFYLKDDFARKVYDYIVDGYLNAVSIGGMVQEWADDGITISKLNMKEFSVVSVPANPEALATNKSLDGNQKAELRALANAYARKVLSKDSGNNEIHRNIEALETLVATLKEVAIGEPNEEQADDRTNLRVVLRQAQAVDKQAEVVIKSIKLKGDNNNE